MTGNKKQKRITVSMTNQEYRALETLADEQDASLSWITRRAISEYLEKHSRGTVLPLPF